MNGFTRASDIEIKSVTYGKKDRGEQERASLSDAEMKVTIDILAEKGISVLSDGKLDKDRSVHLFADGHLYDFGDRKQRYNTVDDFILDRDDITEDTPVQVKSYYKATATPSEAKKQWQTDELGKMHKTCSDDMDEFYELEEPTLLNLMSELLPEDWFKDSISDVLGYKATKPKSLTVSVLNGDKVEAVIIRNGVNKDGEKIKWKAQQGSARKFSPFKFTGKDDVYLASGMGELVLLEQLGVDYICLQMDGAVKHLTEPSNTIEHLIILPDNDKTFMGIVPAILTALKPKKASIVKWEYSDPREATHALKTRDVFMAEVEKHLFPLDLEKKGAKVETVEVDMKTEPIHPREFAPRLKNVLINFNSKFFVGKKMMDVFKSYCSTFNMATVDNRDKVDTKKRYVVPLATGSAKTTAMKLYGAMIKEGSAIFIVRKAMTAVEIVRDINTFAGADIARTYYSVDAKGGRPDTAERVSKDELKSYRIIVLTHKMFHGLSQHSINSIELFGSLDQYRYYDDAAAGRQNRDTVVIDERIDLIRAEEFDTGELEYAIDVLGKAAKRTPELLRAVDTLETLLPVFTYTKNKAKSAKSKIGMFSVANVSTINKHAEVFDALVKVLKRNDLNLTEPPRLRKMKVKDSDRFKVEEGLIDLFGRMKFISSGTPALMKKGKSTVVFSVNDLSLVFGSVVVLDATANINKTYESYLKHQTKTTVMFTKPEIRNYQNTTFNIAHGFKQSKSGLYSKTVNKKTVPKTAPEIVATIKGYLSLLYAVVQENDNMLVVVHKSVLDTFREQCTAKNITFINWGIHAGSNAWSHYNKAAIIGWYRISAHNYANQLHAGAKNYHLYEPTDTLDKDIKELETSSMVEDMVQFFNRIRCRVATDEEGNHEPVGLYLFSNDDSQSKKVIDTLIGEFPHAKVEDWNIAPASTLKKKRGAVAERADRIINKLKLAAATKGDVMAETIRAELGTTKAAFSLSVKSEYFQKELEYYGITYTRLEGVHGKPLVFDFSDIKNM